MPKWHVLGMPDPALIGPEHGRPLGLWPQEGDALGGEDPLEKVMATHSGILA